MIQPKWDQLSESTQSRLQQANTAPTQTQLDEAYRAGYYQALQEQGYSDIDTGVTYDEHGQPTHKWGKPIRQSGGDVPQGKGWHLIWDQYGWYYKRFNWDTGQWEYWYNGGVHDTPPGGGGESDHQQLPIQKQEPNTNPTKWMSKLGEAVGQGGSYGGTALPIGWPNPLKGTPPPRVPGGFMDPPPMSVDDMIPGNITLTPQDRDALEDALRKWRQDYKRWKRWHDWNQANPLMF